MGEMLGKCLGLVSGSEWRDIHNQIAPFFTYRKSVSYISTFRELTEDHFMKLHQDKTFRLGKLNPVQHLRFLPFWAIACILYGDMKTEQQEELADLVSVRERLFHRMIQGGLTRYTLTQYIPTRATRDLRIFKERWAKFNNSAYVLCSQAYKTTPLVSLQEAVFEGKISQDQLLQTLDEILFANLDVTTASISWLLLFLAHNPTTQDQIREEAREKIHSNVSGYNEYMRSNGTLLSASIQESARLRPLAAFSVPQSPPTGRKLNDYNIPGGTNFIVDTWQLNVKNDYWGANSAVFDPTRFLTQKTSNMRYHYWRFGFGPRQCVGRHMVDILMRTIMLHILENYKLGVCPETHWERDPKCWVLQPATEVTCHPVSDKSGVAAW